MNYKNINRSDIIGLGFHLVITQLSLFIATKSI